MVLLLTSTLLVKSSHRLSSTLSTFRDYHLQENLRWTILNKTAEMLSMIPTATSTVSPVAIIMFTWICTDVSTEDKHENCAHFRAGGSIGLSVFPRSRVSLQSLRLLPSTWPRSWNSWWWPSCWNRIYSSDFQKILILHRNNLLPCLKYICVFRKMQ